MAENNSARGENMAAGSIVLENGLRLDLKESGQGVFQRGRLFHVQGPKVEKA